MSTRAIVPVKLSLTEGDYYTLWAPEWKEHGAEWQAFLGDDDQLFLFTSPAAMLAFLESGQKHDLASHPRWGSFDSQPEHRVVPDKKDTYDIIGAPGFLAGRPSHENVSTVARIFAVTRSLAEVTSANDAVVFFATHSVLRNVDRGADHYAGPEGLSEWSAVGRAVLSNWPKVVADLDAQVNVVEMVKDKVDDARVRIGTAQAAAEEARERAEAERRAEAEQADPYDISAWAAAGIDPVKITIQGKTVYTLRTYLDGAPVFLGRFGEIFTFPTPKHLLRWMVENNDHDLTRASTWEDLVTAANSGELEVSVHRDNSYSYAGLVSDMEKGPEEVDTEQMSRGYELLADAADWAGDDSLNSYFLANPRMQDYISYMLGSTESSGYVPSKPYSDHAQGWKELEEMLVKRFSKF
ncbi:hypothetical protein [Corynebacterium halotolerans]|uniref:Primosomal protein n=1 Tax=Corynebacterium halotolerans YIM 70093 = DSM 44683 TaxID=1121362 RepID=M1NVY3_9CORY|nr:hypothetical protein [Corynebacterium halotolerans]AGF71655.1 hypothetical protein A605_03210 [Corynebacterium halotolerans YIM 70093 = DSM 44683]